MSKFEQDYKDLLLKILTEGAPKENRTGVKTSYLFNESLTIDLEKGFPICTSKKIYFDKAYHEYMWMINGLTKLTYLNEHDIHWWDEYADANGDLGKTYGYQIRSFNGEVDQLDYIHREIKANSRRAHMTLWNPSDLNAVKLPPCYTGFTFSRIKDRLNMTMQLRSSDAFLGLPYDICVASLMLTHIAEFNEIKPGKLGVQITDAHIYDNHVDQALSYIRRPGRKLPHYSVELRKLINYKCGPLIKAKLNN